MKRYFVLVVCCLVLGSADAIEWKRCLSQAGDWYKSQEAIAVADNVLLYQRNDGGWHKNTEMAAELTGEQKAQLVKDKSKDDSTIDNGATCRQMIFLARIYKATGQDRFREAFIAGLDYLLRAQYDNGGWPQYYPKTRGYYAHITFNDGAMINVMRLLRDVGKGDKSYDFVDDVKRASCRRAVAKGIECILKCQIVVDGKKLGWCAQHDEVTFKAASARTYEKASLSGAEAVGILEFLMEIEKPSPAVIDSIKGAVKWFEDVKITGIREVRKPAPGTDKGYDKVIVKDPDGPPMWARFYEIGTNRPIFCSRDGIIRYDVSEISYERRNGYSWYTGGPAKLLGLYAKWEKGLKGP